MIAYNNVWLDNNLVQEEAQKEFDKACLSKEENEAIRNSYPVKFYTPNPFIRIGLFILTAISAFFSLGFFTMLILSTGLEKFGLLSIFFGLISYIALEFMVKKNHYKSGVDDALIWMSASFIVGGIAVDANLPALGYAIIVFLIALYFSLRFINTIMSAIASIALLAIVFYSYIRLGAVAKATTPFLIMLASALLYFLAKKLLRLEQWRHYTNCLLTVSITTLVCFFIAGNYFVVRESSIAMFHLDLREGQTIPLGWLFWVFTFLIPVAYLMRGIQKKDGILIRVGLLLTAAIVFTVRYYYHVVAIEWAMVAGGGIMIVIAYALIKYLHTPKYGYTYLEQDDKLFIDKLQVETLVIAESFTGTVQPASSGTQFGGGSGGGGGATGEF